MMFKEVPLRTRRVLLLYKVYGGIARPFAINCLKCMSPSALLDNLYKIYPSVESQKGIDDVRCSIENQKGAIAVQSLW